MEKWENKYRIPSSRLQSYDYGQSGMYFITICTKDRKEYFGKIIEGKMILSNIGKIANEFWDEIPKHFSFVELGEFIVMPNHIHGILILNKPVETLHCNVLSQNDNNDLHDNKTLQHKTNDNHNYNNALQCNANINDDDRKTLQCNVSTTGNEQMRKISPKSGSISTIIRSYKSIVAKTSHSININFDWQSRYYDHIIRNIESFNKISEYIRNNPQNWHSDKFH